MLVAEELAIVNDIITNQEGGWKLTRNENDPDGGWTFAGITRNTWKANAPIKEERDWTYEDMAKHIAENFKDIQSQIYRIYEDLYVLPMRKLTAGFQPRGSYISAAINLGAQKAIAILEAMKTCYDEHSFCLAWQDHYIKLVVDNAEAWRNYALHVESDATRPTTLRAEYLQGWINRTRKYM